MIHDAANSLTWSTATIRRVGGCADHQDAGAVVVDSQDRFCAVLADGIGGLGGKQAIAAVQAAFAQPAESEAATVCSCLHAAQDVVLIGQRQHPERAGSRTTGVALLIQAGRAIWAHSGDSRLCLFRAGTVAFRTGDHRVVPQRGQSATLHTAPIRPRQNRSWVLTMRDKPGDPCLMALPEPVLLQPDDAFLLGSAGLWEYVTELEMIADRLKTTTPAEWLELLEYRVLSRASADHDHYAAVAVWIVACP